jgi:hypothetical protein
MGAPKFGEAAWQLWQFFSSTVWTAHGRSVTTGLPSVPLLPPEELDELLLPDELPGSALEVVPPQAPSVEAPRATPHEAAAPSPRAPSARGEKSRVRSNAGFRTHEECANGRVHANAA